MPTKLPNSLLTPEADALVDTWDALTNKQWEKLPRWNLLKKHLETYQLFDLMSSPVDQMDSLETSLLKEFLEKELLGKDYFKKDRYGLYEDNQQSSERLEAVRSFLYKNILQKKENGLVHSVFKDNKEQEWVSFHDEEKYQNGKSKRETTSALGVGGFASVRLLQNRKTKQYDMVSKVFKDANKTHVISTEAAAIERTGRNKADDSSQAAGVLKRNGKFYLQMKKEKGSEYFSFLVRDFEKDADLSKNGLTRLRLSERLAVLRRSAEGVNELHETYKMLHQDLKPENILVDRDEAKGRINDVTVVDFGLSQLFDLNGEVESYHGRDAMGTNGYAAPEILKSFEYSPGSDMYAQGKMIYQSILFYLEKNKNGEMGFKDNQRLPVADRLSLNERVQVISLYNLMEACMSVDRRFRPTQIEYVRALERIEHIKIDFSKQGTDAIDPRFFALKFAFNHQEEYAQDGPMIVPSSPDGVPVKLMASTLDRLFDSFTQEIERKGYQLYEHQGGLVLLPPPHKPWDNQHPRVHAMAVICQTFHNWKKHPDSNISKRQIEAVIEQMRTLSNISSGNLFSIPSRQHYRPLLQEAIQQLTLCMNPTGAPLKPKS